MRTFLRHFAVVVPLALIVLLGLSPAWGQFKINTFDTAVPDSTFTVVYNGTASNTDPKPYHLLSEDAATKHEGTASLKSEWRMHNTESWGGMNMLSWTTPVQTDSSFRGKNYRALYGDSTYLDWSAGTSLSLWYYNAKPSTAPGNAVQMRFHIYEAGGASTYYQGASGNYEDWYFQSPAPLNDSVAGWHQLIIPLKDNGAVSTVDDQGFTLPGWSGAPNNSKLDLDKIIGWTLEWTAGKTPGDTANGIVFYDDLRLEGLGQMAGGAPLYNFNSFSRDTANFAAGWNNGGLSAFTFSEEKADTLMGPTNLGVDYAVNVKEDWGGGANREFDLPAGTYFPDLSSKSELQLFIKIVKPISSTLANDSINNKVTMRFVLFDYSDGQKEEWYTVADVHLDSVGLKRGWQMLRFPLEALQSGAWGDLKPGRFNTPNGTKDGLLAWDKVGGFKFEISSSRDIGEPFSASLVYSGKFLLSALIPAGFRETDKTPPASVASVQATKGTYSNVISWADVPNEPLSTYNVYVSDKTFAAADAPGVENVPPFGLPLGTMLQNHNLISANTDQDLTLYYGVTATDKAGNVNLPSIIGPITNKAKGVPTISLTPPTSFVADGDLGEWSGIKPIHLTAFGPNPTANIVTNTKIDNDADLSADVYLACDKNFFYVAFDVTMISSASITRSPRPGSRTRRICLSASTTGAGNTMPGISMARPPTTTSASRRTGSSSTMTALFPSCSPERTTSSPSSPLRRGTPSKRRFPGKPSRTLSKPTPPSPRSKACASRSTSR